MRELRLENNSRIKTAKPGTLCKQGLPINMMATPVYIRRVCIGSFLPQLRWGSRAIYKIVSLPAQKV
jgi:hypothetical protein